MDPTPRQSTTPHPPGSFRTGPVTCRDTGPGRTTGQLPPPQTGAQRTCRPCPQARGNQVGSSGIRGGWLFHREPGPRPHGATFWAVVIVDRRVFVQIPPTVRVSWPPGAPSWSAGPPSGRVLTEAATTRRPLCFPKSSRCGHTSDHGQSVQLCPRRGRLCVLVRLPGPSGLWAGPSQPDTCPRGPRPAPQRPGL